jgi:hypothetical protein
MSRQREQLARRHHFIPRLLLKGFSSRDDGGKHFVYQFRREEPPQELSVADVGVERFFHGRTGEIEERLQAKESGSGALVRRLREGRFDQANVDRAIDFIVNMISRTRNVRDGLSDMGTAFLQRIDAEVRDPKNEAAIRKQVAEGLKQEIKTRFGFLPREQVEPLVRLAMASLPADPVELFQLSIREFRRKLDVEALVRDVQLRVLGDDSALDLRRAELRQLRWNLNEQPLHTFVLGDMGPVAKHRGSPELQNPMRPGTIEAIYLPVSSRCLLVGKCEEQGEALNIESLNLASVELSQHLFVATQHTQREERYQRSLGRRARLFQEGELDEGIEGIFR